MFLLALFSVSCLSKVCSPTKIKQMTETFCLPKIFRFENIIRGSDGRGRRDWVEVELDWDCVKTALTVRRDCSLQQVCCSTLLAAALGLLCLYPLSSLVSQSVSQSVSQNATGLRDLTECRMFCLKSVILHVFSSLKY